MEGREHKETVLRNITATDELLKVGNDVQQGTSVPAIDQYPG